jgi:DNA-binding MarR family transcriptional regulator
MTTLASPASAPGATADDFVRVAQSVLRALHSTDVAAWCAVDLTMPQVKALLLAYSPTGASHGEIARALGVGVSTVTGIVDRLVEHGLVERHTDPDDRRLSRVRATQAGIDLLDRLWTSRIERLNQLLDVLGPDERAAFTSALQHLAQVLGERA